MKGRKVILYDGECALCIRSVRFINSRDVHEDFLTVPFQSAEGRIYAREMGIDGEDPDSVILIEDGRMYDRSEAALRIISQTKGTKKLAKLLGWFPQKMMDRAYDFISRYRFHIFGRA